eukprot:TRINITY_DN1485_c0_g2_i1.p1 TRINITY_DN1485_c0_g2~~TRINITY_DN1485_c0_g2_i1.p1  ORF type:complete len:688 (+),score=115.66 TRINITY_DN1485_c0_g2_i1:3-2066(+)
MMLAARRVASSLSRGTTLVNGSPISHLGQSSFVHLKNFHRADATTTAQNSNSSSNNNPKNEASTFSMFTQMGTTITTSTQSRNMDFVQTRTQYHNKTLRPDTPPGGLKGNGVIAIRREDKNRWERRSPLAPEHVATLVNRGIQVIVQPSSRRVFSDQEYRQAGAIVQEDISPASTILGVKEVPRHLLIPERTYMFFSHTIKAQAYNMPLLDEIMNQNIRLIDYERVVDDHNNRLIRFGKFAGYAGMIDFLHGLGNRLLAMGHSTPFLHLGYAHMYNGLESAYGAVFAMGREIANQGIPAELAPMVFVFTGTGASSQGAQEIFRLLPHKYVTVDELPALVSSKNPDRHIVYGVVASSENYIVPRDPEAKFSRKDYYAHPEKYRSVFHEKVAPYMSVLVNCVYWDVRYPRLVTTDQLESLHHRKNLRLIGVADISCDLEGSVEFLKKTTTIDHPLFLYDIKKRTVHDEIDKGDGGGQVLFLAVDNLPSELPREASKYFGDHLMPWIEELAWSDGNIAPTVPHTDLPGELHRAVITHQKKLAPSYEYIATLRAQSERARRSHRILILGSGYVVAPIVDYLARFPRNYITIGSIDSYRSELLGRGRMNVDTKMIDVLSSQPEALAKLIYSHDIVISLVPAKLHALVAEYGILPSAHNDSSNNIFFRHCIKLKKNMVTASYISPEMRQLDTL